jgi:flagellar biosynthesis protein FlhG
MRASDAVAATADQAAGLRRILAARDAGVLAISGAVARSYVPLALERAAGCARDGRRVLLLDLTRGALAQQLGHAMRYELMHVIDAHKRLDQVVVAGPHDVPILPAARGVRALANAWRGRSRFAEFIERAGGAPQLVLAVTPAEELAALAALTAFATLVVVGPEGDADLKLCYAALKRAQAANASTAAPRLLYAGGITEDAARRTHAPMVRTARAFLGGEPDLVGRLDAADARLDPEEPPEPGFPCLDIAQLSRAVAAWPLPRLSTGAQLHSTDRGAARGSNSASL